EFPAPVARLVSNDDDHQGNDENDDREGKTEDGQERTRRFGLHKVALELFGNLQKLPQAADRVALDGHRDAQLRVSDSSARRNRRTLPSGVTATRYSSFSSGRNQRACQNQTCTWSRITSLAFSMPSVFWR